MYFRPSRLSRLPQLGISTGSPYPRKLSEASAMMTPPNVDREDDEDRRHNIGQHMADQDLAGRCTHGPSCQKIVILLNADHGASGYS